MDEWENVQEKWMIGGMKKNETYDFVINITRNLVIMDCIIAFSIYV